jgi:hypothetical protein
MVYFRAFMKKQLFPVQQLVMVRMICVILAVLSKEKIRLYTIRSRGLSIKRPRILPTWYDGKKAIMKHKEGQELVYVDIPVSLLFNGDEPFYNSNLGCYLYKLKGTGLLFAKRSLKKFRVA